MLAYLGWRRRRSRANSLKGQRGESKVSSGLPAEISGPHEMSGEWQMELQVGNLACEMEGGQTMGWSRFSTY